MRRDLSHNINCSGCGNKIIGIRFQCACCPSPDGHGYSLVCVLLVFSIQLLIQYSARDVKSEAINSTTLCIVSLNFPGPWIG